MEIIQQKLIWLLGCVSLVLIYVKLDTRRYIIGRAASVKLMAGVILITFGAAIGIFARAGLLGEWLLQSGSAYYFESIFGYLLGWSLIIWGIIEWSRHSFDYSGRPLSNNRHRIFSDKAFDALGKSDSPGAFLDEISAPLLAVLDCQAISFHRLESSGSLRLDFFDGLTPAAAAGIASPDRDSALRVAITNGKAAAFVDQINEGNLPETLAGKTCWSFCYPLSESDRTLGLLAFFSVKPREFDNNDFRFIEIVAAILSSIMKKERMEIDIVDRTRFEGTRSAIAKSLRNSDSLISALLKSSRIFYEYIPFVEISFFRSDSGPVQILDFPLKNGGKINFVSGYLKESQYPLLYTNAEPENSDSGESSLTRRLCRRLKAPGQPAWLEIKANRSDCNHAELSVLLETFADGLSSRLLEEFIKAQSQLTRQCLGGIRHCIETALSTDDLTVFLKEIARVVVDIEAAAFCRISFTNPEITSLKTAALAQTRQIEWTQKQPAAVSLDKVRLHHKAIRDRRAVTFDSESPQCELSEQERQHLLPKDVSRATILPLAVGNHVVGLLTYGDVKGSHGRGVDSYSDMFIADLAALISMVLTGQRDRRLAEPPKEGPRKLKLQKSQGEQVSAKEITPQLRSRLNGPLAGIMASCEYLKDGHAAAPSDMGHFLNIIERNARKIQDIAAGIAADNR